ncbi:hypothetical protein V6N13_051551 [Hibiscus sabdariffa]|uniref:Uncharacterized protein n=1 Tax=Hibiscus sabdariffa TaxID=183260 RepID=A0ABR2T3N5_9ROSI
MVSIWVIEMHIIVGVFLPLAIVAFIIIIRRKKQQPTIIVKALSNPQTEACLKVENRDYVASSPKLTFLRDEDDRDKFDLSDLLKRSAEILGSGCFGASYKHMNIGRKGGASKHVVCDFVQNRSLAVHLHGVLFFTLNLPGER